MIGLVGLGADGVEVKGDAVRRADLVLAAIALADGAGLVVIDHEILAQLVVKLHCRACEYLLLAQRQDSAFVRSQCRMQMQNGANIVVALFILADDLLIVCLAKECKSDAVAAERRLDDVGNIVLAGVLIEIGKILAGSLLMTAEVVIGAVCNAPQLAPVGEREGVFDVGCGAGIEGKLRRLVVAQAQMLFLDAETQQPVFAVVLPVGEPF